MNSNTKIFLGILFTLAAVGLYVVLNTNPFMFFFSIVLAAGILFFLNRVLNSRGRTNDTGYQKALRTQKKRNKLTPSELQKLTKLKRSKPIPFRVIEGNKKGKPQKDKQRQTDRNIH